MSKTIVCGVDGSPDSQRALGVAAAFARRFEARLVLVHVMDPPFTYGSMAAVVGPPAIPLLEEEGLARQEQAAQLLEHTAAASGLEGVEQRVAVGDAAERLAEIADDERADVIVVGSRGRGAFKTAFLGSVSNSLIGMARCPVLIVPRGLVRR